MDILKDFELKTTKKKKKMKNNTKYDSWRFLRALRSVEMTAVVLLLLLTSCGKYDFLGMLMSFDETPDERFAQSMEYNDMNGYDKITDVPDEYRVYAMTDVHIDNTTHNLDKFVAGYLDDTEAAPFALCLGDLTNGKDKFDVFLEHVQPVADAGRKIYYTAGNHDLYFNQWPDFVKRFHTSTYWFEVQTVSGFKDLYIALESGSGTLGVDQREWLEDVLKAKKNEGYRHIIVFTHTHFFKKDGSQGHTSNFNMEETYDLADLFDRYDVSMVLQGHSHHRDMTVFKDVVYLRLDALKDAAAQAFYTILTVGEGFRVESVECRVES